MAYRADPEDSQSGVAKAATGCAGLDEITGGGLPAGRPTLVCGGPGCGKTVLAMEFLVRGARQYDEPGLFVSFQERPQNLVENFQSFGFELEKLIDDKNLKIAHIDLSRGQIVEVGDFSFDALLIRLEQNVAQVGAKRVVLDTLESIFSVLAESATLRRELGRLFQWLADRGLTTIITGERGKETLTRHGFEEYVSDCVLLLDHRVSEQISKRRLRVVKYRGSSHGTDEYPFLIEKGGLSVIPITSAGLDNGAATSRVSSGIRDLDAMLGGSGYFQGSTILASGGSGTGKSTLCAAFAEAACARGEGCLYVASEESAAQLTRNMESVGIDLERWSRAGLLTVQAFRPSFRGLEEHLFGLTSAVERLRPACMVIDPVSNFLSVGNETQVKSMFTRFVDGLKSRNVTLLVSALTPVAGGADEIATVVSSVTDTWVALELELVERRRRRWLQVVKSRGMGHSLEMRELVLAPDGPSLLLSVAEPNSAPGTPGREAA